MTKIIKNEKEKGIYEGVLKRTVMDIRYVIGIFISLITAIGILRNNKEVKSFFEEHQWADIILAICLIVLAIALAWYSTQQDKSTSMVGTLEPPSNILDKVLFSTKDRIYPTVQFGQFGGIIANCGSMIVLPEDQYLTVTEEHGKLKVSAKIRGKDGLVGEIIDNNWKLKPNNLWDRNYNENALEVKDDQGVLFQMRLLSDRIQFQGIFYGSDGRWIAEFVGAPNIDFTPSNIPHQPDVIKPIFKYPSIAIPN